MLREPRVSHVPFIIYRRGRVRNDFAILQFFVLFLFYAKEFLNIRWRNKKFQCPWKSESVRFERKQWKFWLLQEVETILATGLTHLLCLFSCTRVNEKAWWAYAICMYVSHGRVLYHHTLYMYDEPKNAGTLLPVVGVWAIINIISFLHMVYLIYSRCYNTPSSRTTILRAHAICDFCQELRSSWFANQRFLRNCLMFNLTLWMRHASPSCIFSN